ncbi:hypothetical protein NQZ79_g8492 [Umbelopsis isabellina]|nr:hypothetical protein NQZ79_g8492 [Umbelopsis isabellina]
MNAVHGRLNVLEQLWSELGTCSQDDGVSGTAANSEKARLKLKDVLYHIELAIQQEIRERRLLSAEIEDLMISIDMHCSVLGIQIDSVLAKSFVTDNGNIISETIGGWFVDLHGERNPTFARRRALQTLDNRLQAEVMQRWSYVNAWIAGIESICTDLHIDVPISMSQNDKQFQFESSMGRIHYYVNELNIPLEDDNSFDSAMQAVYKAIPPPSTIPNSTSNDDYIYYNNQLPQPMNLTEECLQYLKNKVLTLETEYRERCNRRNKYQQGIMAMRRELKLYDRDLQLTDSVRLEYLEELKQEYEILQSLMRKMASDYIEKYMDHLLNLWDSCMIPQKEREDFIESLHDQAETMDHVRDMVKEHILYLERLQPHYNKVFAAIKARKTQIQKMVDFEKTASDPRRLFKSSFQLLEEERWRKTCFPTLLKMEDDLVAAVQNLESIIGKHFIIDNERFLITLQHEIADRDAQQTFFGFLDSPGQVRKNNSQESYFPFDDGQEHKARISRTSSSYTLSKSKTEYSKFKEIGDVIPISPKPKIRRNSLSTPHTPQRAMSTSVLEGTESGNSATKNYTAKTLTRTASTDLKPHIGRSMSSMIGQTNRRKSTMTSSVSMQALNKSASKKRNSCDSYSSSDSDKLGPATPPIQRPYTIPEGSS